MRSPCDFQAEDTDRREKNLEDAKKIVVKQDTSLPAPTTVRLFIGVPSTKCEGNLCNVSVFIRARRQPIVIVSFIIILPRLTCTA